MLSRDAIAAILVYVKLPVAKGSCRLTCICLCFHRLGVAKINASAAASQDEIRASVVEDGV